MNLKFILKNFNLDCDLAHAGSSDHHCVLCKCSFRQFYCTQNVRLFFPVPCSDNEAVGEKTSIVEFQIRFFFLSTLLKQYLFSFWLLALLCYQNISRFCKSWKLFSGNVLTCIYIWSHLLPSNGYCPGLVLFCLPFLAHPLRHNAGMLIVGIKCGMNEVFERGCGRN